MVSVDCQSPGLSYIYAIIACLEGAITNRYRGIPSSRLLLYWRLTIRLAWWTMGVPPL